jgi:hypothetical protein
MAIYTFYLCDPGGGASSFEAFALASDAEASERALKMLKEHPSCIYVDVWDDDRPVLQRYRDGYARQAGTQQASAPPSRCERSECR